MSLPPTRTDYTDAERFSDMVVHVAGLALVLLAVPVLLAVTVLWRGDATAILATGIYGLSLLAMILFSALYNTIGHRRWTRTLRRLDHSAIYAKIAGTYTPFLLLTGSDSGLLAALWIAAATGIGLKVFALERLRGLSLALCIGMGWAGILVGGGFLSALSPHVVALIYGGGALYTVGVGFYLFDRLPFHYTIWHVLVLAASLTFYAAVTLQVLQTAA